MQQVLIMGLAAGFCTVLGAGILFVKKDWNDRSLAVFLGLAAGVMAAVVLVDMLPSALLYDYRAALSGVLIGFLGLWLLNRILFSGVNGGDTLLGLGYLIMLGIAMHDLPEGMAIALGSELKARTGMVIALAIGIHNIPEGMAIAAPLLMGGLRKSVLLIQVLLLGLITPLGTICGFMLMEALPGILPWLMGVASGIMGFLVLCQLWPEAGRKGKSYRWRGLILGIIVILMATFV
ncbi:zinc transporter, zip family [hydrocarbon metagenome]|uniref:Zinc transporter, zip family n=1 Tax=hydrocarbon metagenome TaxID=938273 RepID=A0A0W8E5N2_9ZZZZ